MDLSKQDPTDPKRHETFRFTYFKEAVAATVKVGNSRAEKALKDLGEEMGCMIQVQSRRHPTVIVFEMIEGNGFGVSFERCTAEED